MNNAFCDISNYLMHLYSNFPFLEFTVKYYKTLDIWIPFPLFSETNLHDVQCWKCNDEQELTWPLEPVVFSDFFSESNRQIETGRLPCTVLKMAQVGSRGSGLEEECIRWPAQICRTPAFHHPLLFVVI